MANAQHMIELNGKLYDAASGKVLDHKSKTPAHTGQAVDGFVTRKTIAITDKPVAHRSHSHPKAVKPAHKSMQKSQTLMRSAVRKPAHTAKAGHVHPAIAKPSLVSPVRLSRAEKIHQSKLISRFGASHAAVQAQVVSLPVQVAPANDNLLNHQVAAVEKMPIAAGKKVDFEKALHNAKGHKQPKAAKTKRVHKLTKHLHVSAKITRISAMVASVLLLGGFFLHQNLPNLSMRIAATRAGVDARLPGYQPAGFGLSNNVSYSPGEIKLTYQSNSDERTFELTQKKTELNNQALMEEQVAVTQKPYQTLESQGKTIYIYNGSNATWVADGTLYKIEGNSSLTSEQLLRLAASM